MLQLFVEVIDFQLPYLMMACETHGISNEAIAVDHWQEYWRGSHRAVEGNHFPYAMQTRKIDFSTASIYILMDTVIYGLSCGYIIVAWMNVWLTQGQLLI